MNNNTIKTRVVGVDISTGVTTYAVVGLRGEIIARGSFPTSDYSDVNEYVSVLSEKIVMLVEENGGYETVRSVGLSAPSGNYVTGSIEYAANLPWKGHVPLAAMLRDRLGLAVALGNDAHVTAVGEKTYGAAHGMQNFIVISLGHGGMGSCVFMNGMPQLGTDGFAGEIGHTCVVENGRQCNCGHQGCLEEYTSMRGLVKTAQELIAERGTTPLLSGDLTPQKVADACSQGDEIAVEAFRKTAEFVGVALANYASIVDPEAIILTGEMIEYSDWMMDAMCQAFEENIFQNLRGKVKLLVSPLDNKERDLLGASALAWKVKEYSLFK